MKAITRNRSDRDPCLPIQVDLSCMIDGELDPAAIRRVLVHAEVCSNCGPFLKAIRLQAKAHGVLRNALEDRFTDRVERQAAAQAASGSAFNRLGRIDRMAAKLIGGRLEELAKIFYQLGRSYVLMVVSPDMQRVVENESVPIPEYRLRGRELIDEISDGRRPGSEEWVRARSLLNGHLDSVRDNLEKGSSLLEEALELKPRYHEARIFLGHARELSGRGEEARAEFRRVLRGSRNRVIRSFALEHLGNSHLIAGELESAIEAFGEITTSGVLAKERKFFTAYLNLALACARAGRIEECVGALETLEARFPEKHEWVTEQMSSRPVFRTSLEGHPSALSTLSQKFPAWFAMSSGPSGEGNISQEKKS